MLMTYHNGTHTHVGFLTLEWTKHFFKKLGEHAIWQFTRFTGHFSFDFIYQPSKDRLIVIECNPRVHTALCMLENHSGLGFALASVQDSTHTIMPPLNVQPISWHGHDVVARTVAYLKSFLALQEYSESYDTEEIGRDGAWHPNDCWVYLFLYHIQWPYLLLRQALVRGKNFSRINISTARIFEC